MEIRELKTLTMRVFSCPGDRRALSGLYTACQTLARVMIVQFHARYNPSFEIAGYTLEDVAALSIEGLFLSRDGRQCHELAAYFEKTGLGLDTLPDAEFLIALRKIIGIKVTRTVHEVAGEADPQYRKILRNVKDYLRVTSDWTSAVLFDQTVYYRCPRQQALLHLPEMPDDCLLAALFGRVRPDVGIGDLITVIFTILEAQHEFRRAFPPHILASVIREYYVVLSIGEEVEAGAGPDEATDALIDECIERTMRSLRDGLFARYLKRGRLTEEDTRRYSQAARRYCEDLFEKEPRPLFDYYREQFTSATKQSYARNGRTLFEYVIGKTKTTLLCSVRTELDL